jgi:hypothetical protein
MRIFLLIGLVLTFCISMALAEPQPARVAPADSRFGIDYVFPSMPRGQSELWPRTFSKTGAGWINFHEVAWNKIEPRPPSGGVHSYQWKKLDRAVKLWQKYDFRIVITLRMQNGWFGGPIRYKPEMVKMPEIVWKNSDRLPAPEYQADYKAWISALVERYDGDGVSDMPGLRYGVFHYQVGNEYVNPVYWSGTLEDYGKLLKQTHSAAHSACPDVQIISNGIRWNDLFHNDPKGERFEEVFKSFLLTLPSDQWRAGWKRARTFTEGTVALSKHYEILDAGGNGPYPTASAGYMNWVRKELQKSDDPSTAIWDMESRCEPQIHPNPMMFFHPQTALKGGPECLQIMKRPTNPKNQDAIAWYRAEQSRLLAQTFVTRFAAGFEKVFMGMPDDWDKTAGAMATPNPFIGMADGQGNPWPAFFCLKLLVERLDGFTVATKQVGAKGVELYRFDFGDGRKPVWVAWLAEKEPRSVKAAIPTRTVRLAALRGPLNLWKCPTKSFVAKARPVVAGNAGLELTLDPTPVLIQSR